MIEEELKDYDIDIIKSHVAQLMEHFDTVQIFCTRTDQELEGTIACQWGDGNIFARYGQINKWVIREEQEEDDD